MADDIIVFLGPTLDPNDARQYLDAQYLPPADQGAVFRAVVSFKPRAVVLVDGAFAKVPAVRHKEILFALSRGIRVLGAASMGAIRAAELSPYGMEGHGFVYRWYRATPFADDDEVAVAMTPVELGSRPLSEALINMRLTLRRAERAGLVPAARRRELEELARSIHFVERTYATLFGRARGALPGISRSLLETLAAWTRANAIDQKRADAIAALRSLAACADYGAPERRVVPFRLTEAWVADLDAAGFAIEAIDEEFSGRP